MALSPRQGEITLRIDDNWKQELYQALKKGKWESIYGLIRHHEDEAFRARLTDNGDTVLLAAFHEGKKGIIDKLVEMMRPAFLVETDKCGNTALHLAANVGFVEQAEKLVKRNNELLSIPNNDGIFPIQSALDRDLANARRIASYLLLEGMKDEIHSKLLKDASGAGAKIMQSLIKAGFYDFALELLEFNEKLAWEGEYSPLEQMATDQGGFRSGSRLSTWQSLIYSYSYVPTKQSGRIDDTPYEVFKAMIWNVLAKVLVHGTDIPAMKLKHLHAFRLAEKLCLIIAKKNSSKLGNPLLLGAKYGIEEIVNLILDHHPTAINHTDKEKRSVFHIAVMYRQENILKIAHMKNMDRKGLYHQKVDVYGNNILHLVGYKPFQAGIYTDSGAIFQMQHELQWFMRVTKLVTPQESTSENGDHKIPFTLFEEEHDRMAAKEKEWMSKMATASSVAASLVATVAFAAVFQVPGGDNGTSGIPNFSDHISFTVFGISDALALFSSITSVLTFLSIFTSRYGLRDYLRALPHRVIIGLISLLLAFVFLTIAFSSALFIVFVNKKDQIRVPITTLSVIPVILYANLQLPSLVTMIKSTFCPSILCQW